MCDYFLRQNSRRPFLAIVAFASLVSVATGVTSCNGCHSNLAESELVGTYIADHRREPDILHLQSDGRFVCLYGSVRPEWGRGLWEVENSADGEMRIKFWPSFPCSYPQYGGQFEGYNFATVTKMRHGPSIRLNEIFWYDKTDDPAIAALVSDTGR